ncbi:MAG: IS3 family transposase, partial [Eubacteriales bacterium]|nr:IS3 family transposase [Eubacteriales bacterium]
MTIKYRVIERFREIYSVTDMCKFFEVSRSGYYAWRNRQQQESKDQWLMHAIIECQNICNQTYGIRRVKRWIERNKGKTVNLKAILRIMRKL